MARINIEDSLWKDDRFQDLMIKTGNRHTAKGMILELWTLAQEYWFPNRKAIPLERIKQAGLQLVIDVGLAVIEESGVKAIGTDKAFDWLFQRQEAGKKGGKANALRLEAVATRSIDEQATNQSKLKQIEPSSSFSSSSSFSFSNSDSSSSNIAGASKNEATAEVGADETPKPVLNPEGATAGALTWRAYKAAYLQKYGEAPTWNAKVAGQLKSFTSRIPKEEAPDVAAFFVTHPNRYYVESMHPVGLLLRDAEKLRTEWATGRQMTGQQAKQGEKTAGYQSQLERIARGEL